MKTAIVTGASRGIGAATARLLARRGYNVVVNYSRSKAEAEQVASDINSRVGKAIAVKADMGAENEVISLFETAYEEFGAVDLLVNNAAVNPSYAAEAAEYKMME